MSGGSTHGSTAMPPPLTFPARDSHRTPQQTCNACSGRPVEITAPMPRCRIARQLSQAAKIHACALLEHLQDTRAGKEVLATEVEQICVALCADNGWQPPASLAPYVVTTTALQPTNARWAAMSWREATCIRFGARGCRQSGGGRVQAVWSKFRTAGTVLISSTRSGHSDHLRHSGSRARRGIA